MTDDLNASDDRIVRRVRSRVRVSNRNPQFNKLPNDDNSTDDIIRRRARLPAVTQEARELRIEQQVAQCEILMLKGFQSRTEIMKMLGLDSVETADRLMARVLARWEITGQGRDLARYRGEAIGRVQILMQEGFVALQNLTETAEDAAPDAQEGQRRRRGTDGAVVRSKVALIRTITALNKQYCDLNGLTPKNIARVMSPTSEGSEVLKHMRKQDALVGMARQFLEVIKKAKEDDAKTISGEVVG